MKSTIPILLALATNLPPTLAGIAPTAAEECGDLGVMSYTASSLDSNVDPSNIRKCREHPLTLKDGSSPNLQARECWFGDKYGCSKGYCWESCDRSKGTWCWTAWNGGHGNWRTCSGKEQCAPAQQSACGKDCKDAKECGCSCH
ncbi:hypothetical protein CCUS01_04905 [Colletotrichum cuscutae]|uniref:IDI-2 n=1 Tax=Colletotrichum cuscutae TaxID=1209917 RepID=A0AAI9VD35_9PEZI|nr:hypothetical protein CCUS01_04905 [Colletotrichum cuscutae]